MIPIAILDSLLGNPPRERGNAPRKPAASAREAPTNPRASEGMLVANSSALLDPIPSLARRASARKKHRGPIASRAPSTATTKLPKNFSRRRSRRRRSPGFSRLCKNRLKTGLQRTAPALLNLSLRIQLAHSRGHRKDFRTFPKWAAGPPASSER